FTYQGSSDFTKVFVMNLAAITAAGSSYSSVGIFWEGVGTFAPTSLSSCNGPQATNPCITDKSKFKIGGATFVPITIQATNLREVLSRYFEVMKTILERHGGTVEKYIGDAIMAVFGLPKLHEDDALRAARATVEMRAALAELNEELERRWGARLANRTGVNTG